MVLLSGVLVAATLAAAPRTELDFEGPRAEVKLSSPGGMVVRGSSPELAWGELALTVQDRVKGRRLTYGDVGRLEAKVRVGQETFELTVPEAGFPPEDGKRRAAAARDIQGGVALQQGEAGLGGMTFVGAGELKRDGQVVASDVVVRAVADSGRGPALKIVVEGLPRKEFRGGRLEARFDDATLVALGGPGAGTGQEPAGEQTRGTGGSGQSGEQRRRGNDIGDEGNWIRDARPDEPGVLTVLEFADEEEAEQRAEAEGDTTGRGGAGREGEAQRPDAQRAGQGGAGREGGEQARRSEVRREERDAAPREPEPAAQASPDATRAGGIAENAGSGDTAGDAPPGVGSSAPEGADPSEPAARDSTGAVAGEIGGPGGTRARSTEGMGGDGADGVTSQGAPRTPSDPSNALGTGGGTGVGGSGAEGQNAAPPANGAAGATPGAGGTPAAPLPATGAGAPPGAFLTPPGSGLPAGSGTNVLGPEAALAGAYPGSVPGPQGVAPGFANGLRTANPQGGFDAADGVAAFPTPLADSTFAGSAFDGRQANQPAGAGAAQQNAARATTRPADPLAPIDFNAPPGQTVALAQTGSAFVDADRPVGSTGVPRAAAAAPGSPTDLGVVNGAQISPGIPASPPVLNNGRFPEAALMTSGFVSGIPASPPVLNDGRFPLGPTGIAPGPGGAPATGATGSTNTVR